MSGTRQRETKPSQAARAEAGKAGNEGKKAPETSAVEWVVAAISGLIVAGAIGFMTYDVLSAPSAPPAIEVRVDTVMAAAEGYLVQFTARNTGATTAAGVQVEGSLREDTMQVEESQATFDFVPSQSSRRGGLFFSRDPRRYRLEMRAVGYTQP